jgi:peroxiredoxin Q/BCP
LLKFLLILIVLGVLAMLATLWLRQTPPPEIGTAAPDFDLLDATQVSHKLTDFRGRWLVLYFYPKDSTPTCTAEACNLRDGYAEFQKHNVALLGVSLDDAASHAKFAQHHSLPFPLLADSNAAVARAYGSLWDFGLFRIAKRHTFLIRPDGRVAKVYREIDANHHAQVILADLVRLQLVAPSSGANNLGLPPTNPSRNNP